MLREVLLDDEKGGPAMAAAYSLSMLVATQGGQQYSRADLRAMLSSAGFADIDARPPSFGYRSLILAKKP